MSVHAPIGRSLTNRETAVFAVAAALGAGGSLYVLVWIVRAVRMFIAQVLP